MDQIIDFKKISDAIHVSKENGTDVNYYIFDEFEIHLNIIAPKSIQEWHYHSQIEETIVVTKGTLLCKWKENEVEKNRYLHPGELVRVMNSVHTFENDTDEPVEFSVFRFVPTGENKRELIKNDKAIVEI